LQIVRTLLETPIPKFEDESDFYPMFSLKKAYIFNEIGAKGWNSIHAAIVKEQKEIVQFYLKK